MLETQTQIIGASCNTPAAERIEWLQIYADSLQYGFEREQIEHERTRACQPSEAELTKAAEDILSWVAFKETDGHWWGHDTDCGNPVPEAVAILKRLLRGEA